MAAFKLSGNTSVPGIILSPSEGMLTYGTQKVNGCLCYIHIIANCNTSVSSCNLSSHSTVTVSKIIAPPGIASSSLISQSKQLPF